MAINSYLVDLSTEIPITINDNELKEDKTFYEVVFKKAEEVMGSLDLNKSDYQLKVVSEVKESK